MFMPSQNLIDSITAALNANDPKQPQAVRALAETIEQTITDRVNELRPTKAKQTPKETSNEKPSETA